MINLAKFMGKLVMPRNAGVALLTHGLMRLVRLVPPLRTQLEELGIKPKNAFARGLFVNGKGGSRLRRGAVLAQGWVRGGDGTTQLSDDVFGGALALIGFGQDVSAQLDAGTANAFAAVGGKVFRITHRGQRLHAAQGESWEDLEGVFLPRSVPFGWAVVVRPDRTIVHDGPAEDAARLVRESLALLGASAGQASSLAPVARAA
jgi:3-(3-hydroxy-phenyl)propionate hydroxylase